MEKEENAVSEKIILDFEYFIKIAVRRDISWDSLAFMLTDLTTNLDRSKQVIRALVEELEKWVSKVENNSNHDVPEILDVNEKQASISIQKDKQNYEETIQYIENSENESIGDVAEELSFEPHKEVLHEKELDIQTELIPDEDNKTIVDFPVYEFYEFIGNNEKPSLFLTDYKEVELPEHSEHGVLIGKCEN